MAEVDLPFQYVDIHPTTIQFTSSMNEINIVRIAVSTGEKVTWEFLEDSKQFMLSST